MLNTICIYIYEPMYIYIYIYMIFYICVYIYIHLHDILHVYIYIYRCGTLEMYNDVGDSLCHFGEGCRPRQAGGSQHFV